MTPKHNPIIDLTVTTSSNTISVDTTESESVLKITTGKNPHPSSKPDSSTLSYSISTPRKYSFLMSVETTEDEYTSTNKNSW